MDATSIVLLVGVVSFWVIAGMMAALFGRTRKALESAEKTLDGVRSDLSQLMPVLSGTLVEMEKTGREVGQTASEVRVLTKRVNAGSGASVVSNTVNYLPAVLTVLKIVKPLFDKRKSRK